MPRHEADGLVADRAVRHQHRGVDLVVAAALEDLGRIGLDGDAVAAVGRCAEEARRDFADRAFRGEALELRQREPGAAVGRRGVGAVIGDVRNSQIVWLRGVAVIDRIEFCAAVVFRARTWSPRAGSNGAAVVMMATRDWFSGFVSGWNGADV